MSLAFNEPIGCSSFKFRNYPRVYTTSGKKILILYAKQPLKNHQGRTPNKKSLSSYTITPITHHSTITASFHIWLKHKSFDRKLFMTCEEKRTHKIFISAISVRFIAFARARNRPWSEFCSVAESAGAPIPPRPRNLPQAQPDWACSAISRCSFRLWSGSRVIDMKPGSTNPLKDSPLQL